MVFGCSSSLLIVAIVATACYLNSLDGDFVLDDSFAVTNNEDLRPSTPLSSLLAHDFWGDPMDDEQSHKSFRPITVWTFRQNFWYAGIQPWGYHAVNVVLHAMTSCVFLLVCRAIMPSKSSKGGEVAALAGLMFATHPIHTDAVASVVGRADVLAGLLFGLALLCYLRFDVPGNEATSGVPLSKYPWILLTCLFSAAAMLSKETGITVLGVCAAYQLTIFAARAVSIPGSWKQYTVKTVTSQTILWGCAIALVWWRMQLMGGQQPTWQRFDNPAAASPHFHVRALTYLYLGAFNGYLLLLPSSLCCDWSMNSIPLVTSVADPRFHAQALPLLLAIAGGSMLLLRWLCRSEAECADITAARTAESSKVSGAKVGETEVKGQSPARSRGGADVARGCVMGVLLLLVPYAPASNVLFPVGFVVAERVLYIPSMGYCLLASIAIVHFPTSTPASAAGSSAGSSAPASSPLSSYSRIAVALALLGALAARTIERNNDWRTAQALYRSGLAVHPHHPKLLLNLAADLRSLPDWHSRADEGGAGKQRSSEPEALRLYRLAVIHAPDFADAHLNLGNTLVDMEALQSKRPQEAQSQNWLEEASLHYEKAIAVEPRQRAKLHSQYAGVLLRQGGKKALAKAEEQLRIAVGLKQVDGFAQAALRLAGLLGQQYGPQGATEAERLLRTALAMTTEKGEGTQVVRDTPNWLAATTKLSVLLANLHRLPEAVVQMDSAMETLTAAAGDGGEKDLAVDLIKSVCKEAILLQDRIASSAPPTKAAGAAPREGGAAPAHLVKVQHTLGQLLGQIQGMQRQAQQMGPEDPKSALFGSLEGLVRSITAKVSAQTGDIDGAKREAQLAYSLYSKYTDRNGDGAAAGGIPVEGLRALAPVLVQIGQPENGAAVLNHALSLQPSDPFLRITMGTMLAQQGQFEAAMPHLQLAQRLQPTNPLPNTYLKMIRNRIGSQKGGA
jgi:tetratricopeptide (TPR) repeat protein